MDNRLTDGRARLASRLHFNEDPLWEDPIPPEITSNVLARRVTSVINRTSLLAWCLMNIPSVEVADLTGGGWIAILTRDFFSSHVGSSPL
jgi:hypothetical protein